MSKKKWMIPLVIVILLSLVIIGLMVYMSYHSLTFSTGRYLTANNGAHLLILDHSPIQMSNQTGNESPFRNLTNGDRILVLHDGVETTYPARTGVYAVFRLSKGTAEDIPSSVKDDLTELGWLGERAPFPIDEPFPTSPPALRVSLGGIEVDAWRGTFSWQVHNEDGTGKTVHADSMHPLDAVDSMIPLTVSKEGTITLHFEEAPDEITLKRYASDSDNYDSYETIPTNKFTFEAKAGDYLYEITAHWDDPAKAYGGTVHYAFRTED